MKLDQQATALWKRVGTAPKAAFFTCIILGYLVHLYAFTNLIPNADGLSRVFDLQQMTVSGRWFLHYASSLNAFTQMPGAIGLVSLVLLALAAALSVHMLGVDSGVLGGLCGAVMAAFPCLGFTYLYMFTASAYCLAILMAVGSVWLALKGKWGFAAGVVLLALTMGTYQVYVTVSIALSVLLVLRALLTGEGEFRDVLALGLRLMAYLACGAVLYYLILQVFLKVKGVELLSYLGMDAASSGYPFARLPGLVLDTYKQVISFFFLPGGANGFATGVMVLLDVALVLAALACVWVWIRGDRPPMWRILGAGAMAVIFPLAINFGQIISPHSVPTPLMKYAYVAVYLAVFLLLDLFLERLPGGSRGGALVLACVCALLVSFVNTNNLMYTASAQAHRAVESYLTRLMSRVEDCEGYEPGMEVVIIGAIPDEQLHSTVESYYRTDHYSVPIHTPATANKHIYYYLNDWLSIPVEEPEEETMLAVAASAEFEEMPLYPARGSVRVVDDRVVVRLREDYTPKSDYEIAYENRR